MTCLFNINHSSKCINLDFLVTHRRLNCKLPRKTWTKLEFSHRNTPMYMQYFIGPVLRNCLLRGGPIFRTGFSILYVKQFGWVGVCFGFGLFITTRPAPKLADNPEWAFCLQTFMVHGILVFALLILTTLQISPEHSFKIYVGYWNGKVNSIV